MQSNSDNISSCIANENSVIPMYWTAHSDVMKKQLSVLLRQKSFADVTLICNGGRLPAHKLLLCASSPKFKCLLQKCTVEPAILHLRNVRYDIMQAILSFIYTGEAPVKVNDFETLLSTAAFLRIRHGGCFQDKKTRLANQKHVCVSNECEDSSLAEDFCLPEAPARNKLPELPKLLKVREIPLQVPEIPKLLPAQKKILVPMWPKTPINGSHLAQSGNCPHCSRKYFNQSALKYHVRLMHSDFTNTFCCYLCPSSFLIRDDYKVHMLDKHNAKN